MGHKSNLITIRKNKKKDLNLYSPNIKNFLYGNKFLDSFIKLLKQKNVLVAQKNLNFVSSTCFLDLSVFYRLKQTSKYNKKRIKLLNFKLPNFNNKTASFCKFLVNSLSNKFYKEKQLVNTKYRVASLSRLEFHNPTKIKYIFPSFRNFLLKNEKMLIGKYNQRSLRSIIKTESILTIKKDSYTLFNNSLNRLILKQFKFLKNKLIVFNFKNLNNFLTKQSLRFLYKKLKRFEKSLFDRRKPLFIDLIKISSLFIYNKVNAEFFLNILAETFGLILKKNHSKFLRFIKLFFKIICSQKEYLSKKTGLYLNNPILGLKLLINGKLRGKPRASTVLIEVGSVPLQTLNMEIEFSKKHVYTRYGAFGFQLWVSRKN